MSITRGRHFPVQTVHLGQAGSFASMLQTTLPEDIVQAGSSTGWGIGGQLGMVAEDQGNVYRLVQINNTTGVATAAGDCVYFKDSTQQVVTSKASESVAGANAIAGGTLGTITSAQSTAPSYIWIQIGGVQTVPTSSASTVAGDMLVGDGTNNKQLVRIAAAGTVTALIYAIALGSASGGNNATSARWVLGSTL